MTRLPPWVLLSVIALVATMMLIAALLITAAGNLS